MEDPPTPSIMGSENPKFMERSNSLNVESENGQSPREGSVGNDAKRDGLTREERMRLVRARQMEEYNRKMEELKQHQMQVMKAKKQLTDERQRKLEDLKTREDSRRAAVEARRRQMEDEERRRKEAILRKHEEIFERIAQKRRQHESRKMAFGVSTYRLSDQDSVYTSPASRRAISAGGLARRPATLTARSHMQNSFISPASAKSARGLPSPSTPSRSGGMETWSGVSKASSSDNSPAHSARRTARSSGRSQPPPVTRNRLTLASESKSRQGSRPVTAPIADGTPATARAKRPDSLMTRSVRVEIKIDEPSSSQGSIKSNAKRSQSVGNMSARVRRNLESPNSPVTDNGGRGKRTVSPAPMERIESGVDSEPMSDLKRSNRKPVITSEAEAKAALAEKRRLARLKAEAAARGDGPSESEETRVTEDPAVINGDSVQQENPSVRRIEEVINENDDRRNSQASLDEFTKAEAEASKETDDLLNSEPAVVNLEAADTETVLRDDESIQETVVVSEMPEIVRDAEESENKQRISLSEKTEETSTNETVTEVTEIVVSTQSVITVESVSGPPLSPEVPRMQPADPVRDELERRRKGLEEKEEEERLQRRLRLEAIRNLTKGKGSLTGSSERLSSPAAESKPVDPLENARKLLSRRRENENGATTPSSENFDAMVRSFSGVAFAEPVLENGHSHQMSASVSMTDFSMSGSLNGSEYTNGFLSKEVTLTNGSVSRPSELLLNFDEN